LTGEIYYCILLAYANKWYHAVLWPCQRLLRVG
jgi:hypothetical protein